MRVPVEASKAVSALYAVIRMVQDACVGGAPDGVVFAAMQSEGCTLQQWQTIRDTLIKAGKIEKRGDILYTVGA